MQNRIEMEKSYIGSIITKYSRDKFPPLFNVTEDFLSVDIKYPTIIIGLDNAREYIHDFSILRKSYENDTLWWTYKKTERRYEFENDMEKFYRFCIEKYLSRTPYYYLDIARYRYNDIKRIIEWINSETEKICFQTTESKFIFIYDTKLNIVFGLSLTLCEYCGVNRKKIISRIKKNPQNVFIYNTSFIDREIHNIIGNNTHYILPLAKIFSNN